MGSRDEGFPEGSTPQEKRQIRQAALDLLRNDDLSDGGTVSSRVPENWQEQAVKVMEARMIEQGEARKHVITHASQVIDAMTDKLPGVHSEQAPAGVAARFATAPTAIPAVGWENVLPGEGLGGDDWKLHMVGNIGEFYSDRFSNERPAAVFNSGFYAGVLAVKLGLVDPEAFHHDSEPIQPPAASGDTSSVA